jgi:hypothetical protein
MSNEQLVRGEVGVVADFVEMLARRRAAGEFSSLYPEVADTADTIMHLRQDAPGYLQPELAALEARCTSLMKSIAH